MKVRKRKKPGPRQLTLDHARKPIGHGGWRPGAGRPRGRTVASREVRANFAARFPLHVTWRIAEGVPSLRKERVLDAIRKVFEKHASGDDFRVVEFNVLGNHMHLVVEATGREALRRRLQGLAVRLARAINKALGRKGKLFAERY